jgi:Double-GTPase 2
VTEAAEAPVEHEGTCSNSECLANQGGACAEDHADKIDCEFFELKPSALMPKADSGVPRIPLPDGEALRRDELERVLRSHPAELITPLGRVGAGKTTLIAIAYHLLRSRRLEGWRFTGSETVVGLARRAHDASFGSRGLVPKTPRTQTEESGLVLHLGMRRISGDARHPILLSDLSGEHVERMANGESIDVVTRAISASDHLPIVVDGEQIADPRSRPLAVYEARSLIKMVEKQARQPHARLSIVITKGDLLVSHDVKGTVDAICRQTAAEGAPFFVTADRQSVEESEPGQPIVSLGQGVPEFLEHVVQGRVTPSQPIPTVDPPAPSAVLVRMWGKR